MVEGGTGEPRLSGRRADPEPAVRLLHCSHGATGGESATARLTAGCHSVKGSAGLGGRLALAREAITEPWRLHSEKGVRTVGVAAGR